MKLLSTLKAAFVNRNCEVDNVNAEVDNLNVAPADKSLLGIHAERLLADPVLHLAFDRVRDKLNLTWAASTPADGEGRERCYMQLQGLERVKGELLAILGDRKVMEHASKEKEKRDERERERRAAV